MSHTETEPFSPDDADLLEELVARCVSALEQDGQPGVERICREHPAHAEQLRERLSWLAARGLVPGSETPETIGPFRVLEKLGEGAMGVVYKAEQREPVRRRIAVKVVKLGMDSKDVLARFDNERSSLAAMSHSAIAKVFDAGTTERGQPYFAMELVEGLPLTEFCDKHRLSLPLRIGLFAQVCAGVQHAHQKGIVHRDLKPGNILVVREGESSVPKILDFGLIKATNPSLLARTVYTEQQRIMGTPEYMAPEQALGDGEAVDTRADIYALGVILYELLTGQLPFGSEELRGGGWVGLQKILSEVEPQKPSDKLSTLRGSLRDAADRRQTTSASLHRHLRSDLDWIVLKAIAKEPERRYASAHELAADLQRYLHDEPVLAGPPSTGYRLRKLVKRYRVHVVAGALVFLTLVAGIIGTTLAMLDAQRNRELAEEQEQLANARSTRIVAQGEVIQQTADALQERTDEFDMLANVVSLEEAKAAEANLYPAWPEQTAALEAWLTKHAEPLSQALPHLRETVADLEARSVPRTRVAPAALREAASPQPLEFEDEATEFLHRTLVDLVARIEAFEGDEQRAAEERLSWSRRIAALTTGHPAARTTWRAAREAIAAADGELASTLYRERPIDLRPQTGLVPIGVNPKTLLWEFYHLRSAADPMVIPRHDEDGNIPVGTETGIVFVLIPGGRFWMGTQSQDPDGQNYDPLPTDTPLREEELAPYFLARHEVTQAQWERLSGGQTPSYYAPGRGPAVTRANPVEQVNWNLCNSLLSRHGLKLPSESQWERACRAGTSTPWFTGAELQTLSGYANVLDRTGASVNPVWGEPDALDDGFVIHARVGSLLPNPFGLFDMHGNVFEWCEDSRSTNRVARGGGFLAPARFARSSHAAIMAPEFVEGSVGLRAARAVR